MYIKYSVVDRKYRRHESVMARMVQVNYLGNNPLISGGLHFINVK